LGRKKAGRRRHAERGDVAALWKSRNNTKSGRDYVVVWENKKKKMRRAHRKKRRKKKKIRRAGKSDIRLQGLTVRL